MPAVADVRVALADARAQVASTSAESTRASEPQVAAIEPTSPAPGEIRPPWWRERRAQVGLLAGVVLLVVAAGVTFGGGDGMRSTANFCAASNALFELDDNATEAQATEAIEDMAATAPAEIADDVVTVRDFDTESMRLPYMPDEVMDESAFDEFDQEFDRALAAADEFEQAQTRIRDYIEENCDPPEAD